MTYSTGGTGAPTTRMPDAQDLEPPCAYAISDNVGRNAKLSRSLPAPRTAQFREDGQVFYAAQQMRRYGPSRHRLILFDVGLNFRQVANGLPSPLYSHTGGYSGRFFPQDRR